MNSKKKSTIAIVKFSALGDVLWTLPLARLIRQQYPESKLYWITDPQYVPLLKNEVDAEFIEFKRPHKLVDYYHIWRTLRPYHFDTLICAQHSLRINLLYPLISANNKIGFDSIRGRDGHSFVVHQQIPFRQEHQMECLASFAEYLNIQVEKPISKNLYQLKNIDNFTLQPLSSPYVVLHPASSLLERNWDSESYTQILLYLQKMNITPVITGNKSDIPFCQQIEKIFAENCNIDAPKIINFAGMLNLNQLASLFKDATLVIAPDTGPIHLANAVGTPVLGLYAAVPTWYTGPYQQTALDYYDLARKTFSPKTQVSNNKLVPRVHHPKLMSLISIKDVIMQITKMLPSLLILFFLFTINMGSSLILAKTSTLRPGNFGLKKVQIQQDSVNSWIQVKKCRIDIDKIKEKRILGPLFREIQHSHNKREELESLKNEISLCSFNQERQPIEGPTLQTRYLISWEDGRQSVLADIDMNHHQIRTIQYFAPHCPQIRKVMALLDDQCSL